MRLNKEIRIKTEADIPDNIVMNLISSVIAQGKVSNGGKTYCYVSLFQYKGKRFRVETNDSTKSIMFYVLKEKEEDE